MMKSPEWQRLKMLNTDVGEHDWSTIWRHAAICHMDVDPLTAFAEYGFGALLAVAPEKEQRLRQVMTELNVRLAIVDDPGFVFGVGPREGVQLIRASTAACALVWALTLWHWVRYKRSEPAQGTEAASGEWPITPDDLESASAVFEWSLTNLTLPKDQRIPWPKGLPEPTVEAVAPGHPVAVERVSTELALCAIGWIMHHELAHVRHGDPLVTAFSQQQERRADRAATAWVLDGVSDPAMILKRGVGIALAGITLVALELEFPATAAANTRSHPFAATRLLDALDHEAFGDDHVLFKFAAAGLRYHMARAGIAAPDAEYETARDCLLELCQVVHRAQERS